MRRRMRGEGGSGGRSSGGGRGNGRYGSSSGGGRGYRSGGSGYGDRRGGQPVDRNSLRKSQDQREKYINMARDALGSGDRVLSEYYYQHADHYQRVVTEIEEQLAIIDAERNDRRDAWASSEEGRAEGGAGNPESSEDGDSAPAYNSSDNRDRRDSGRDNGRDRSSFRDSRDSSRDNRDREDGNRYNSRDSRDRDRSAGSRPYESRGESRGEFRPEPRSDSRGNSRDYNRDNQRDGERQERPRYDRPDNRTDNRQDSRDSGNENRGQNPRYRESYRENRPVDAAEPVEQQLPAFLSIAIPERDVAEKPARVSRLKAATPSTDSVDSAEVVKKPRTRTVKAKPDSSARQVNTL